MADAEFFRIFDKCFRYNSRFSVVKENIPLIGDNTSTGEQVDAFYAFWDDFKSWREFSQHDEYDPEEAHDRYEKRWMESQNKRESDKLKKVERKRLIKLVDRAYNNDPRVCARKVEEQAQKDLIKKGKKNLKA